MSAVAIQAVAHTTCGLCGQRLPAPQASERYCCPGCAHVAAILRAVGPETEAAQRALTAARARGLLSVASPLASQSTAHHSPLTTHHSPQANPGLRAPDVPPEAREELRVRVHGLACPSCAWLVEAVLATQSGVADAHVDYLSDTARIVFDLRQTCVEALSQAVADAGYGLAPLEAERNSEERRDLLRLALAAFVAMNQMTLSWVGYDAFLTGQDDPRALVIGWLQLALALPVVTWSALPLYRRALAALRCGRAVMETLLSLGVLAAAALSLAAVLAGQTHVYLETAAPLVALSLAGRALERWLKRRATRSLTDLLCFAPTKARRADDGRFAPLHAFARGDRIAVQPGETVPLDVRATGPVVVREALLTGEPHPVKRRAGEMVLAGSAVDRGPLVGVVERSSGQTVADAIRQRVDEALRRTDAGSRMADRLTQGFVPLVLLVALAALVGHLSHEASAMRAVLVAVSVLVVACPCAFGVAASLALSLAVLRLARTGILVKDPSVLERLRGVDTVVFDKTGTLTRGEISILRIGWLGREDASLLASIRAVEAESRHPIGIALARLLPRTTGAGCRRAALRDDGQPLWNSGSAPWTVDGMAEATEDSQESPALSPARQGPYLCPQLPTNGLPSLAQNPPCPPLPKGGLRARFMAGSALHAVPWPMCSRCLPDSASRGAQTAHCVQPTSLPLWQRGAGGILACMGHSSEREIWAKASRQGRGVGVAAEDGGESGFEGSARTPNTEHRTPLSFGPMPRVIAESIVEVPGLGVTGMVAGRRVAIGRPELFAQAPTAARSAPLSVFPVCDTSHPSLECSGLSACGGHPPRPLCSDRASASRCTPKVGAAHSGAPRGASRVWFGYAGEAPMGHIDLADALRPEAAKVVAALAERGMATELLSGDAPEPTRSKAAEAGIPSALGGLRPEQKAERVRALRQGGRKVAFIGDGFNDAEAMAAADVGVAMASGADLAMLAAPVVITRGDLHAVVELLDTGRRAVRVLRGNFIWAFVYNVALLPVAAFGLLAPIHAAALMVLSSASVALNSLRASNQ